MAHPRSLCENATVPEHAMPHDVFLSYASTDRAAADAVCAALEARGIRCWIAPRDVPAGADWGEAILTAIGRAHAMVLVLSRQTAASVHVRNEVVTAVSQSLALVPVRIEDCQPGGALRLHLAGSHWLNVYPAPIDQHADALAGGVRLALAADATIEIPRAQAAAMVAAARASAGANGPAAMAAPRQAPPAARPAESIAARPGRGAAPAPAGAAPRGATPAAPGKPAAPARRGLGIALAIGGLVLVCAAVAAAWYYEPRLKALFGATFASEADTAATPAQGGAMVAAADRAAAPGAAAPASPALPPAGAAEPPRGLGGVPGPLAGLGVAPPPVGLSAATPPAGLSAPAPTAPAPFPAPQPASAPRSMTQAPPPRAPAPAARLTNAAGAAISQLFVARVDEGIGREDWLGHAQVMPGNAVLLRAPAGQGCLFNIRVVYVGGMSEVRPGVDLCAAPELRFEGKGAGGSSSSSR